MSVDFSELCRRATVEPKPPLTESKRKQLLAKLGGEVPPEVAAFYEACNGGKSPSLWCRFLPLAEAVKRSSELDHLVSIRLFPLFESDYVAVSYQIGLDGPLAGYVFRIDEDGTTVRVHAPSIEALLKGLATKSSANFVCTDENPFTYPRTLTSADKKTVQKLIERSKTHLEKEEEAWLLITLALSMMNEDEFLSFFDDIVHPNPKALNTIYCCFQQIDNPKTRRAVQRHENNMKPFLEEAVKELKKNGFKASIDGVGISIKISKEISHDFPMWLLMEMKDLPDCWDRLLEHVREAQRYW